MFQPIIGSVVLSNMNRCPKSELFSLVLEFYIYILLLHNVLWQRERSMNVFLLPFAEVFHNVTLPVKNPLRGQ